MAVSDVPKPPASLYVFGPLGFGHALVMNGLIRVLARQNERVKWLTHVDYVRAVRETVSDLPNVQVLSARDQGEVLRWWNSQIPHALKIGSGESTWDSDLYKQAGVTFEARWTECRFPAKLLKGCREPKKTIALIHEDRDRKFFVKPQNLPKNLDWFHINKRRSILDWLPDIFAAQELHFIDSAFLNLAESLYAVGALPNTTLVFHRYAKAYPDNARWPELRAPWQIIN